MVNIDRRSSPIIIVNLIYSVLLKICALFTVWQYNIKHKNNAIHTAGRVYRHFVNIIVSSWTTVAVGLKHDRTDGPDGTAYTDVPSL